MLDEKKRHSTLLSTLGSKTLSLIDSVLNMKHISGYKAFSNALFTGLSKKMTAYFEPLKNALELSDINILPNTYLTLSLSSSFLAAVASIAVIVYESILIRMNPVALAMSLLFVPAVSFLIVFSIFYMYPFQKVHQKTQNINTNLPFAINHMAAIASAGVPPVKCFEMLAEFKEYGDISNEAKNIVRRVNAFGEDITQSIKYVAQRTPSRDLKDLLYGILSVIESGGNLKDYLNEMAQLALFNYKLSRKKYIHSLSTYADIYTAILIAAPLFLVSILSVMSIVPGQGLGGISIIYFMTIGIYVIIPVLNLAFLIFITYTQPEI